MSATTIIKLTGILLTEVYREYKKSKKQNDIEQLETDPHGWFADRFGRLSDADDATDKAEPKPD